MASELLQANEYQRRTDFYSNAPITADEYVSERRGLYFQVPVGQRGESVLSIIAQKKLINTEKTKWKNKRRSTEQIILVQFISAFKNEYMKRSKVGF